MSKHRHGVRSKIGSKKRRILQFTATPFREDGKPLDGDIVFNYPLKKAQEEGYFRPIRFKAVVEFNQAKSDEAIAMKALEQLRADVDRGHILMARVESVARAKKVFELYRRYPEFNPVQLHTGIKSPRTREKVRRQLIAGESRIVVCVDMLGEGFDLPELKIAAFHDIKKTLPVTLQLAGRFTRARPDLGDATFVANTGACSIRSGSRSVFVRPRERWQRGCASFHELDGHGNAHDRHKTYAKRGWRVKMLLQFIGALTKPACIAGRPGLSTERQGPVRPDKIVIAAQEFDVSAELVGATGVAGRATAQVRRALPYREVETLDERGVQGLGVLRLPQCVLQPIRRADLQAPLDPDDPIVPPSLEHLTIDARGPKEASDHPEVVLEAVGGDQGRSHEAPPEEDVVDHGLGVSIGAAAEHAAGPTSGPHFDGREQPYRPALAANERAELISLQLQDVEIAQHSLVESALPPSRPARAIARSYCGNGP